MINNITKSSSVAGLLIIPCITGQVLQIFIGTFVVKYFAKKVIDDDALPPYNEIELAENSQADDQRQAEDRLQEFVEKESSDNLACLPDQQIV